MTTTFGLDQSGVDAYGTHTRADSRTNTFGAIVRIVAIVSLSSFALSGTLKEFPLLTAIPVDLTQLTALGAFGCGLLYRFDTRTIPNRTQTLMLALFLGIVFLGALGGLDTEYGAAKTSKALQVTFVGVLSASLAIRNFRDLKLFQQVFLSTAFVMGLPLAAGFEGYRDQFGRFTSEGGSTINLGQAAGVVLFSLAAYFLVRRQRLTLNKVILMSIAGGICAFVLVGVGSRGPLQGVVVAVAFAAVASLQSRTQKAGTRFATLVGAGIAVLIAVWSSTPETSRERITEFGGNSTADQRIVLWREAWERLGFDLLGSGFGSFEQLGIGTHANGIYTYPHNMFLEYWYETGVVGVILCLLYFGTPITLRWFTLKTEPLTGLLAAGMVVYYWSGAMVSGDLNDHRTLWLLAIVAAVTPHLDDSPTPESSSEEQAEYAE